jgi:hypothetical protein
LRDEAVAYVFMGKELGGRPVSKALFSNNVADYERMAETVEFLSGVGRIIAGAAKHRIALLCAERDPLDCHRCLLVGRKLHNCGAPVRHILANGTVETHGDLETRLLLMSKSSDVQDLFLSDEVRLSNAYRERGRRVAFCERRVDRQSVMQPH